MAKNKATITSSDTEYGNEEDSRQVTARFGIRFSDLLKQIHKEYQLCHSHTEAKRATQLARLKLFNNQRRDPDAVGDPLLFTVFMTVFASLYDDHLQSSWEGRGGEGDKDIEENLNALSEYDYSLMRKDVADYDWTWDALFFGRGLMALETFDRSENRMCPVPEVWDPMTFMRDPRASSVNGNMVGTGGLRFFGRFFGLSIHEMKDRGNFFNLHLLKKDKEKQDLLEEARAARREAQGLEDFDPKEQALGKKDNYEFRLIDWYTHIAGKKYRVTLANTRNLIVAVEKIEGDRWPVIDRTIYPMAHDWDGVSIPDLTEDKQRARAVLINLGLVSVKDNVANRYLYDKRRIKHPNDTELANIPVDGDTAGAYTPVPRSAAHQHINLVMDILDTAAQRATATPEIQQGIASSRERTLGELNLVSSKVDTRYSLSAKIFGWSEKDFWEQWYRLYKRHFRDSIDEKIIRIQGAMAPSWRPLTRENIIADIDPDVRIESKVISEAKRLRTLQSFMSFAGLVVQDPTVDRRFVLKKLGHLHGMTREELDLTFPSTPDELQAENENEQMNQGNPAEIDIRDDHATHLRIHAKAEQNAQSVAHMKAHKEMMLEKRNRPDLFPGTPPVSFDVPSPGVPSPRMPESTTPTQ